MEASQSRRVLIAVDTNVLLDLAEKEEDVTDAVQLIKHRLRQPQFLMPPTVRAELADDALHAGDFTKQERAMRAFQLAKSWKIQPIDLFEARTDIARRIGQRLRRLAMLPEEEVNDGLIMAESAILGSAFLLTSDEHLRGIDFERLTLELRAFDLTAPVIATPREIVRKFF